MLGGTAWLTRSAAPAAATSVSRARSIADALDAFKASVRDRGFRVIELGLAERGLTVNELADASVGEQWA